MQIHVVSPRETIGEVAGFYGVSVNSLININNITNPDDLVPGQTIIILKPEITHTVEAGENLYFIARKYNMTALELLQNNPELQLTSYLPVGEEIVIRYEDKPDRAITVSGYVYPYVDLGLLEGNLPYLTYLAVFSYGFNGSGDLIPINDEEIIRLSLEYDVAPILVLAPIDQSGIFNNYMASQLLNDKAARTHLIDQVMDTVRTKGYRGVDLDFDLILPEASAVFIEFIQELKIRLVAEGYQLFVVLSPKDPNDTQEVVYQDDNYDKIGTASDYVITMTYDWGYTLDEPGPVAAISRVSEVLSYAVTEIDPAKILMGIPNYGYNWVLPFERGVSDAKTIGNEQAIQLSTQYQTIIQYDTVADAPYYHYWDDNGMVHTVWFEDARSIKEKLDMITNYGLAGVAYWNFMRYFRQNWMVLKSMFNIKKLL